MSEAEVAEAYRERFLRERRSLEPILDDGVGEHELPRDVAERVHRGLTSAELALWRDDTGDAEPPGWMSVVVYPEPRRKGLLNPVRDGDRIEALAIPDRWDPGQAPLQHYQLQPTSKGLRSQLPPRDDAAPAYLVAIHNDGVMEYGTTLEPALRRDEPADNRIIFTVSHPQQAHDYLQFFGVALGSLGYDGPVAAQISFDHTRGVNLGIGHPYVAPAQHPIEAPYVRGSLWRFAEPVEVIDRAPQIVKEAMNLVFAAGGIPSDFWFIDDEGRWVQRR